MKIAYRFISLLLICVVLSAALSACVPFYYPEYYGNSKCELSLVGEATMTSVYDEETGYYDVYIDGVAENNTGNDVTGCYVTFIIYDSDGNVVGTAEDYLSELKNGEKWRFRASGYTGYEPSSFAKDELYGYDW